MKSLFSRLTVGWVAATVVVVILALLPVIGAPREWILYVFLFLIYLAMSNMWNLLAGYTGLISLCQPVETEKHRRDSSIKSLQHHFCSRFLRAAHIK